MNIKKKYVQIFEYRYLAILYLHTGSDWWHYNYCWWKWTWGTRFKSWSRPFIFHCTLEFQRKAGIQFVNMYVCIDISPWSTSVLDMTQNYLVVRLQCWSFGECKVLLHCHRLQIHCDPEWKHLISFGQIELFNI